MTEADNVAASLRLRVPEWATGDNSIKVNGEAVDMSKLEQGYVVLKRTWKTNDKITIDFPMETVAYHEKEQVKEDIGYIAVKRGPVVFAAEGIDNDFTLTQAYIPEGSEFTTTWCDNLMKDNKDPYGLKAGLEVMVGGKAIKDVYSGEEEDVTWRFIPYYAWNNRDYGAMRIFVHENKPEMTLRDYATVSASGGYGGSGTPGNVMDGSTGSFWNGWGDSGYAQEGYKQQITYDFGSHKVDLSACIVNWYSDGGGVIPPTAIVIEYDKDGVWTAVTPKGSYTSFENGKDNTYEFETVTTTKIRMTMTNENYDEGCGAGIREWSLTGKFHTEAATTEEREPLVNAVKTADALNENEYTPETWAIFAEALKEAKRVSEDADATKEQVEEAKKALDDAMNALSKKNPSGAQSASQESVTKLTADITSAGSLYKQGDYTPESWKAFGDALEAAKKVIADKNATQAQVDEAQKALADAIAKLVKKQAETEQPPAVEKLNLTIGLKEKVKVYKKGYTYETSNKKYVTVKKGVIQGVKRGKATVTVKNDKGQVVQIYIVTVKNAPKKISKVTPAKKTLKKGKSVKLKVKLPKGTASYKITYTSSNKKVATVDAKGVVKAKKKGKATITVKTFNKKTKKVKITVK